MKNALKFILISIFFLSLTTANSNANMFNKFKKGFYFEKYKNAEEAKAALLELHPIGSDVDGLVKTLEGARMKCGSITNPKFKDKPEYKGLIYCDYFKSNFIIFSTEWRVIVKPDPEDIGLISFLEVHKFFHAL